MPSLARRSRKSVDLASSLVVEGLHALGGQRAFVLGRPVGRAGNNAARIEFLAELRIGRPVGVFEVLIGVEVVEIAEELVEAVPVRQLLLEIAEMVLAELRGHVTLGLQDFGERDVFLLQARRRSRRSHRRQAGADRQLPCDEGGAAGRAARLGVERGQPQAFLADPVDVGRRHAHQVAAVGRDVEPADVVAKDDQNVRLARFIGGRCEGEADDRRAIRPMRL